MLMFLTTCFCCLKAKNPSYRFKIILDVLHFAYWIFCTCLYDVLLTCSFADQWSQVILNHADHPPLFTVRAAECGTHISKHLFSVPKVCSWWSAAAGMTRRNVMHANLKACEHILINALIGMDMNDFYFLTHTLQPHKDTKWFDP